MTGKKKEPDWFSPELALSIHDRQIAEHGGGQGVRDAGLLESALARPRQLWNYQEPDVFELAASYGFGIARNHPFVDGNKRTAFVLTRLFLLQNGITLTATMEDRVLKFLALAAGDLNEEALAAWLRENSRKI